MNTKGFGGGFLIQSNSNTRISPSRSLRYDLTVTLVPINQAPKAKFPNGH